MPAKVGETYIDHNPEVHRKLQAVRIDIVVDEASLPGSSCRCYSMWLLTLAGTAIAVAKGEVVMELKAKEVYEFTILIHQSSVPKKLWEEAVVTPKDSCQAVLELILGEGMMKDSTGVHTAFVHKQAKPTSKSAPTRVEPMVHGFFRMGKGNFSRYGF